MQTNEITFGVEIETATPVAALNAAGWTVAGYHSGRGNETQGAFPGWKIERDGSIQTPNYNFAGAEFVSPVLKGIEGLNSIKALCERLTAMGAKVNKSTGLHIHVGFDGDAAALRRLICLTANIEKALYAATGTHSREGNHYCNSIKRSFRGLEDMKTMEDVAADYHAGDRYHVLNLTNLMRGRIKAVEFRVFAGTLNATKIAGYVQLCIGLVQKALTVRTVAKWDADQLTAKSAVARKGQGLTELNRLFALLGWTRAFNCKPVGILQDAEALKTTMTELRRLAKKYDESASN